MESDAEEDGRPDQVDEEFQGIREMLLELADMVSYNMPLKDHRALAAFKNSLSGARRMHSLIKDKERQFNSTTTPTPATWASENGSVMRIRTRPKKRSDDVLKSIRLLFS